MAPKRKLDELDAAASPQTAMLNDFDMLFPAPEKIDPSPLHKFPQRDSLLMDPIGGDRPWRTLGTRAVPSSLPLANMVTVVQELIDPDFHPVIEALDNSPRFLKPLPSRIPVEDIEYLRSKGALTIPEPPLRNELLRAYVQWVHNFIPLLDLHEFLRSIAENDPDANISLLLFQAVMFAGTAFVDLEHLQAAGFATRRDARKAFFMRTRLLYSFDCEEDRIAILQAILLMTYWHEFDGSPQKDIWHWVGVCNTQAQSIGLHRDPTGSGMSPATQRLRIRLWWSLYSRDRLIALALRRPTQINEGTCDVPLPRLSDFDIRPFHPAVSRLLQCRQSEDVSHQRRLATMFIEKVKLCQCLGRVLFAQYSPSNHNFGATHKTTITLVPREASEAELDRCSQKLDAWVSGLPKDAQFIPPKGQHLNEGEKILLLHSAMLRMIYYATCSALHRPQALIFGRKAHPTSKMMKWSTVSRQKMQDAAAGTTEIAHGLNRLGLTKFLPASGLTVLLPAAVVHLTNLTSSNPAVRDESRWNFHRCVEVLNKLKDIYPAADHETAYLEEAVKLRLKHSPNSILVMQNATFGVVGGNRSQIEDSVRPTDDHLISSSAVDDRTACAPVEGSTPAATGTRDNQSQETIIELDEDDHERNTTTLPSTNLRDANMDRLHNTANMTFNDNSSISDSTSSSSQLHSTQNRPTTDSAPANPFLDRNSSQNQPEWDWNVDVDILNDWLVSSDGDGEEEEERESESESESHSEARQITTNHHHQQKDSSSDHTTSMKNIEHDRCKSIPLESAPKDLLSKEEEDILSPPLPPLFPPSVGSSSRRDSMVITGDLERDLGFA
ncbi:hypothetical protein VTN77DRAFT_2491 [Rasamsonia byssochlamydoides]|uniref:uncharacterized protein n=1 Tax=Rasamsonia byssochlamydoides TaxID=89139 RepID=UPI0037436269